MNFTKTIIEDILCGCMYNYICAITEQVEHMEVLPLSTTDTRSLRAKHNIFPSGVLGHGHGSTYSGADQIRMAMVGGGAN